MQFLMVKVRAKNFIKNVYNLYVGDKGDDYFLTDIYKTVSTTDIVSIRDTTKEEVESFVENPNIWRIYWFSQKVRCPNNLLPF